MAETSIETELREILTDMPAEQKAAIEALYARIKDKKPNEILPIILAFKMPAGSPLDADKKQKLTALLMKVLK
ncbi:MAG: hypothetical protein IJR45_03340 [Firmicutes bacterium]|nr:hypothetical protein [Bacillota bacterium]MBQ9604428.1 hypothetical protein [Bacillota bacterium]